MHTKSPVARTLLALAASATLGGCGVVVRSLVRETTGYVSPGPSDEARARTAWAYFRATRNGQTGLSETAAGANFTTPSTIGDQIIAAIAADRLHAIEKIEFDATISALLAFLSAAPLSNGEMPGRFYDTRSGQLSDPPATNADPGWSGVEAGRLLVALRMLADRYPMYRPFVLKAVSRWQACRAIDTDGGLRRALPSPGGFRNEPDVGNGYAAYAAQGFRAWGDSVSSPRTTTAQDAVVSVEGIDFPLANDAPLLTAPYALLGLEFGWKTPQGRSLVGERVTEQRLWLAQQRRWTRTGIPTARSDFRRTSAPYHLVDAVLARGYPWSTTDDTGPSRPELALLATRTAFALSALHDGKYARLLATSVANLGDAGGGWYEGRYEQSGAYEWTRTAATNAMVIETILYRHAGPIFGKLQPLGPTPESGRCAVPDLADRGERP